MIILDVFVCIILFSVGYNLKNWIGGFTQYEKKVLDALFFWHAAIGIGYVLYLHTSGGGDAYMYWDFPKMYGWEFVLQKIEKGAASGYIYLINYFPSTVLGLSFFTGTMIGSQLGFLAFVYLLKTIKENVPAYLKLKKVQILGLPIFPYILFLPNIHFWTSGLGKDTILFFCIISFIYAINKWRKRIVLIGVSFLLSVLIRPHILLYLILALGAASVLDGKIKVYQKALLFMILIAVFSVMLPKVMEFTELESFDTEVVESYSSKKASALNKEGAGSGIDISSYPYPLKVFTFLFRPLFVDMQGMLGLVASAENLILLIFFIRLLKNKPLRAFKQGGIALKAVLIFFIIGSLTFPLILGNLGVILRQKTPFMIMFIVFGFWVLTRKYETRKLSVAG